MFAGKQQQTLFASWDRTGRNTATADANSTKPSCPPEDTGICVCWSERRSFFLELPPPPAELQDSPSSLCAMDGRAPDAEQEEFRDAVLQQLCASKAQVIAFDTQHKLRALAASMCRAEEELPLGALVRDPKVAAWMLDPSDKKDYSLPQLLERFGLPTCPSTINRRLNHGIEACMAWKLMETLQPKLQIEGKHSPLQSQNPSTPAILLIAPCVLSKTLCQSPIVHVLRLNGEPLCFPAGLHVPFQKIEMPLVPVLVHMERTGS